MKWSITWTSSVEAEGQSLREQAERPSQHPPPLQERVLEKVWSFKADSFSILIYSLYAPLIFPGGGKASAYNAGDLGSNPGLGKSPGEGNGNPLQYSCLENPMDRGAWGLVGWSMGLQRVGHDWETNTHTHTHTHTQSYVILTVALKIGFLYLMIAFLIPSNVGIGSRR